MNTPLLACDQKVVLSSVMLGFVVICSYRPWHRSTLILCRQPLRVVIIVARGEPRSHPPSRPPIYLQPSVSSPSVLLALPPTSSLCPPHRLRTCLLSACSSLPPIPSGNRDSPSVPAASRSPVLTLLAVGCGQRYVCCLECHRLRSRSEVQMRSPCEPWVVYSSVEGCSGEAMVIVTWDSISVFGSVF